ncbi:glycerate kinase [Demequina zhanjiangensis]|uniref:Glycerate kinase n=1 Tax=Demequina zhanjiangensis TaxID=3051659 RepID=A0ABT8G0K9_9MICO|nr:glycerate kinase [Demequina sp. SYSU T00b26]MDN4472676.1 glycerate kinase [Demequina sp. SYSU T00b26]
MRVAMLVEGWPGVSGAIDAADRAALTWSTSTPGVHVTAIAVGDGGPRSADAADGTAYSVPGVDAIRTSEGLLLAPADGALRWDPIALGAALRAIAADADAARTVIVPVGDVPPAGDAADVWGASLQDSRETLADLDLVALVSSDRPLLGFHGMSAAVREGREADAALAVAAQEQEERWRQRAQEADEIASTGTVLLGPRRLSDQPRTGAAGGMAYSLAALGARLEAGSHSLARWSGLGKAVEHADVVVAVVDTLSHAALDHGAAAPAGGLAAARGVPAVVVTSDSHVGKRDLMAAGIHGSHVGAPGPDGLADAIARAARTWTPVR